jgi:hypothetical protein
MIEAADRVLVIGLGLASRAHLSTLARACSLLVGIGDQQDVLAARSECAHFDNVMFAPGDRHEIPWRDGYFTVIVDTEDASPSPAMLRVLAPGGRITSP